MIATTRLGRAVVLGLLVVSLPSAASAQAAVPFRVSALEPAGSVVSDVAVGDLDGRNGPDIVTAYQTGGVSVNLNKGDGTFGPAQLYATGCYTAQVELADLGGINNDNVPDGHLDAAVVCNHSGNAQYLGRLAGDGHGGFGAADIVPALTFGPFPEPLPQQMALADLRGPGLPPVPVFTFLYQDPLHGIYTHVLCATFDWTTETCLDPTTPDTLPPLVAGVVADARVFALGGAKGLLDWGPYPNWHSSTRALAPNQPSTATHNVKSITIGDLAGNGPDIITASGTGSGDTGVQPAGVLDISYGDLANGVPDQAGTQWPSAPGVENIATGDFNRDGHTDVIGSSESRDPASGTFTGAVFVQAGNGAGALAAPQLIPISHTAAFSAAPVRVADLDHNGSLDAVAIVGGQVQVLLNQTPGPAGTPPPPGPKPKLNPLVGIKGLPKTVTLDGAGNLGLGSASNPPTASVELTITLPAAKTKAIRASSVPTARAAKAKKPVTIGHLRIKIAVRHRRALKVHLTAGARARLRKGTLKATLVIVAVATDGTKRTSAHRLTIKPARKRSHRK